MSIIFLLFYYLGRGEMGYIPFDLEKMTIGTIIKV